jgi:hypothetical protein
MSEGTAEQGGGTGLATDAAPDTSEHTLAWSGEGRFEYAHATKRLGTLSARGTMLFGGAEPYRVDYQLDTAAGFVTKRLTVYAAGLGWSRTLRLARDAEGVWNVRRTAERPDDQVDPIDPMLLIDATDCDIALSAFTAAMPVLRHGLHRTVGRTVVVAAMVAVPELTVHRQEQTYSHLRADGAGGVVRYTAGTFNADLTVGADGFVTGYPGATRV